MVVNYSYFNETSDDIEDYLNLEGMLNKENERSGEKEEDNSDEVPDFYKGHQRQHQFQNKKQAQVEEFEEYFTTDKEEIKLVGTVGK